MARDGIAVISLVVELAVSGHHCGNNLPVFGQHFYWCFGVNIGTVEKMIDQLAFNHHKSGEKHYGPFDSILRR